MFTAPFTLEDLEFDLAELEPADWDAMAARLRWHLSTPYAFALKTVFGEALVSGAGTAIAHNGSGWIGDRLMHPRFRGDELEAQLVNAMVAELETRGCTTVTVLIGEEKRELFTSLGFQEDSTYLHFADGQCEAPTEDEVELYEPHHALGILHMDKRLSGEDRRNLISEHLYAGRIYVSKGRVLGYYLPLLGEGLVMADNVHAGLEMLRWHMPHVTNVTLPGANAAAIEFLRDRKYQERGKLLRMYRGERLDRKPETVYAWIGGNLG